MARSSSRTVLACKLFALWVSVLVALIVLFPLGPFGWLCTGLYLLGVLLVQRALISKESMRCTLGFHDYTLPEYIAEGACAARVTCKRCGKEAIEDFHLWGDEIFMAPDSCKRARPCQRCDALEHVGERHSYRKWDWDSAHSCVEVRSCERCDKREARQGAHAWGDWTYQSDKDCVEIKRCARCGDHEVRHEHTWSQWEYPIEGSCERSRRCERCALFEALEVKHQMRDDVCLRCGYRDTPPEPVPSDPTEPQAL